VTEAPSCARCGAALEPGQEYCLECGAPRAPGERPRWGPPLLGAAVALALAAIVIALVYASVRDDAKSSAEMGGGASTAVRQASSGLPGVGGGSPQPRSPAPPAPPAPGQ
jgi:hypothetical protein